jgi:hypothetical protein
VGRRRVHTIVAYSSRQSWGVAKLVNCKPCEPVDGWQQVRFFWLQGEA